MEIKILLLPMAGKRSAEYLRFCVCRNTIKISDIVNQT